jgi:hypothetical protein
MCCYLSSAASRFVVLDDDGSMRDGKRKAKECCASTCFDWNIDKSKLGNHQMHLCRQYRFRKAFTEHQWSRHMSRPSTVSSIVDFPRWCTEGGLRVSQRKTWRRTNNTSALTFLTRRPSHNSLNDYNRKTSHSTPPFTSPTLPSSL